jgi:hypothetical protein
MTTIDRKQKVQELIEFHQKTFDALGISNPFFVASMAYKPFGKSELHISFFPSQLLKGKDIYTELVNKEYDPDTTTRTLYKWNYNKFWKEEYDSVELENTDDRRYLIPISELIAIEAPTSKIIEFNTFDEIMDPDEDCPFDQMTVRDFAAIMLQRPISRKKWLNEILKCK